MLFTLLLIVIQKFLPKRVLLTGVVAVDADGDTEEIEMVGCVRPGSESEMCTFLHSFKVGKFLI